MITETQVREAANSLVNAARTSNNAAGFVTCDQVRAFLVRTTRTRVEGVEVSKILTRLYGPSVQGYYTVK